MNYYAEVSRARHAAGKCKDCPAPVEPGKWRCGPCGITHARRAKEKYQMAKVQTRKSISVRGDTYSRLREYAKGLDKSMSDVVEEVLGGVLPVEKPAVEPESRRRFNPGPVRRKAETMKPPRQIEDKPKRATYYHLAQLTEKPRTPVEVRDGEDVEGGRPGPRAALIPERVMPSLVKF